MINTNVLFYMSIKHKIIALSLAVSLNAGHETQESVHLPRIMKSCSAALRDYAPILIATMFVGATLHDDPTAYLLPAFVLAVIDFNVCCRN
jgi:hypothetical protein